MSRPRRPALAFSLYDTRPELAWTAGADALYLLPLSGDLFEAQLLSAMAALTHGGGTWAQQHDQREQHEHRDAVLQLRAELRVLRAWPTLCGDVDLPSIARRAAETADWSPDDVLALRAEVALHERAAEAARAADPARLRRIRRERRRAAEATWVCERCARTTRVSRTRGASGRERVLCGWCAGRHDREQRLQEAMRDAHHTLFPEA